MLHGAILILISSLVFIITNLHPKDYNRARTESLTVIEASMVEGRIKLRV